MVELKITEECIGCESCVEICPEVFAMNDTTGLATVKEPTSTADCVAMAIDICPVRAIVRE